MTRLLLLHLLLSFSFCLPIPNALSPIKWALNVVTWRSGSFVLYQNEPRDLSPSANYTDRAAAACRRSQCQILRLECRVVSVTDSYGRILDFLLRSRYFFFQVAPQLYSWGWMGPVPDPLLHRKSGSAGNRTRDLWICSQELWPIDHRDGLLYST
jgi:hypothetical protein